MTTRLHRWDRRLPFAGILVLALAFFAAGGCGVGDPTTTTFAYEGIGPEGGTIQAGGVSLYIPPDALAQETAIEILPQAVPLPIEAPAQDPCLYSYLGPIYCCGPVGMDLLVPGVLRVSYDPNLIPIGNTVDDLVLLLWDNAAGVMRPTTVGVVHDTVLHFFEVDAYVELGHIAVGVRNCPARGLVFVGDGGLVLQPGAAVGPSGSQTPPPGLYLAQADNSVLPTQIPTEDAVPSLFVCAPDGSRVLYEDFLPNQATILRTVSTAGGPPVTVVGDDRQENGGDLFFGWRRADGHAFFEEFIGSAAADPTGTAGVITGEYFSRASSDGSFSPAPQHFLSSFGFLVDQHQSSDGSVFLLRVSEDGTDRIDMITAGGLTLSSGLVPVGGGIFSPRFVPGSTDVYLVDSDHVGVLRYTADGVEVGSIFSQEDGELQDFVLAPDGEHYAYIVRIDDGKFVSDEIRFGTLAGGDTDSNFLDEQIFPAEVVFHPAGQLLYVDSRGAVRVFRASDAVELAPLPVNGLRNVDVSTATGELLLLVRDISRDLKAQPSGQFPLPPGIYVTPPDGSAPVPVNTNGLTPSVARWLLGWRATPGVFSSRIR